MTGADLLALLDAYAALSDDARAVVHATLDGDPFVPYRAAAQDASDFLAHVLRATPARLGGTLRTDAAGALDLLAPFTDPPVGSLQGDHVMTSHPLHPSWRNLR